MKLLTVAITGSLGSIARYLIYVYVSPLFQSSFPWATLLINVTGCFVVGLIGGLGDRLFPEYREMFLIGSIGFLGAYTTFSAFGLETFNLLEQKQIQWAILNILANVILGLLAVWGAKELMARI
jgi:fluoride exporter